MSSVISKSVARSFELLELFRRERRPLTASAIEAAMEIPQASALVLARELAALGYLSLNPLTREYFPSERLADIGAWLVPAALPGQRLRPLVDEIARATRETTSLCTATGRFLHIDYSASGTLPGSVLIQTGRAAPLPCSCAGRAVLATLNDAAAARIVADVRLRDRQYTIKPDEVLRDARIARRRGHVVALDLMLPGVGAIGFALPTERTGGQFAIVIAAPSPRIRQRQRNIVKICRPILENHLDAVANRLRRAS